MSATASATAGAIDAVVNNTVDKLSGALGAAVHNLTPFAQQIFGIYVRQQYAIGLALCFGAVLAGIALYFSLKAAIWGINQPVDYYTYSTIKTATTTASVAMGIGFPVSIGSAIALVLCSINGILHLVSPQYYAIQTILTQIHGGGAS